MKTEALPKRMQALKLLRAVDPEHEDISTTSLGKMFVSKVASGTSVSKLSGSLNKSLHSFSSVDSKRTTSHTISNNTSNSHNTSSNTVNKNLRISDRNIQSVNTSRIRILPLVNRSRENRRGNCR